MPAKGVNSKKEAGNAKKAANAAAKQAKVDAVKAKKEDEEWAQGSKSNAKKEAADAKKREAALKKAEREAELAKEESSIKTIKTNPKAAKKPSASVAKASSSLDAALAAMDGSSSSSSKGTMTLNASGIDNALDALSLAGPSESQAIDRHPERRVKAAYRAFEERRMQEGKASGEFAGLRQNQIKDRIWNEFQKSEENPHNKSGNVSYDAKKEDVKNLKQKERDAIESRLTERDL